MVPPNRAARSCRWNAGSWTSKLIQSTLRCPCRRPSGRRHAAAVRCRSALRREPGRVGFDPADGQVPIAPDIDRRHAVGRPAAAGTLSRGPGRHVEHDHHRVASAGQAARRPAAVGPGALGGTERPQQQADSAGFPPKRSTASVPTIGRATWPNWRKWSPRVMPGPPPG